MQGAGTAQLGLPGAASGAVSNAPNSLNQSFPGTSSVRTADQAAFFNSLAFTLIAAAVGLVIILLLYFATGGVPPESETKQDPIMRDAARYMVQHDYDSAAYQYNSLITSLKESLDNGQKPKSAEEIAKIVQKKKLLAQAKLGLCDVYLARHQFEWALTESMEAVDSLRQVSTQSVELAFAVGKVASVYAAQERFEYALEYYDEAIEMYSALKIDRVHSKDLNEFMESRSRVALLHQRGH
jgi:tetratricopeptide (TPR) repeat protein